MFLNLYDSFRASDAEVVRRPGRPDVSRQACDPPREQDGAGGGEGERAEVRDDLHEPHVAIEGHPHTGLVEGDEIAGCWVAWGVVIP